jgi:hypothetical protein
MKSLIILSLWSLTEASELISLSHKGKTTDEEAARHCFNCVLNLGVKTDTQNFFCPSNNKCFNSIEDLDESKNLCDRDSDELKGAPISDAA